jgi:ATP synthase protein I
MAIFLQPKGRIIMVSTDPAQDPDGVVDPRLASLDERLREVQHTEKVRTTQASGNLGMTGKGASQGNRVLSTLIGFPLGGAVIGWFLDRQFGSSPKALLVLLFLGIAAAGREIWRISKERPE